MTFQLLKYFIETVNSGSISKAAERLFIAQSSLSIALRALESEVGHTLFLRTSKGTHLTDDGEEFLLYAENVLEQIALLEERWVTPKPLKPRLLIISQHYAFAVKAFINMVKKNSLPEYEYSLKEGRILDIIEEVRFLRSEVGILYMDCYNHTMIEKLAEEGGLEFHPLFTAKPYVLISAAHPLAHKKYLMPSDLDEFPRVSFEQSDCNVFTFHREDKTVKIDPPARDKANPLGKCKTNPMTKTSKHKTDPPARNKTDSLAKSISVGDRGMMYHLLLALNAYTLTTGLQGIDLYGGEVAAIPLCVEDEIFTMEVGWISRTDRRLTQQAQRYIEALTEVASEF